MKKIIIALLIVHMVLSNGFGQAKKWIGRNAYNVDSKYITYDEKDNITNEFLGPMPYDYNIHVYLVNQDIKFHLATFEDAKRAYLILFDKTGAWALPATSDYRKYLQLCDAGLESGTVEEYIQKNVIDSITRNHANILSEVRASDYSTINEYSYFSFTVNYNTYFMVENKNGDAGIGDSLKNAITNLNAGRILPKVKANKNQIGIKGTVFVY